MTFAASALAASLAPSVPPADWPRGAPRYSHVARDIAADRLPSFALVAPNPCNEMHGLHGANIPAACDGATNLAGLICRGDVHAGALVRQSQADGVLAFARPDKACRPASFTMRQLGNDVESS